MYTQIATTKEQSERLIACGILPYTADMCLSTRKRRSDGTFIAKKHQTTNLWVGYPCWRTTSEDEELENVPAWSLTRLLELLPVSIMGPTGNEYMLELSKLRMHNAWEVQWMHAGTRFITYDKHKNFQKLWDGSPIEACVKAIEWLHANGHIFDKS